MRSFLCLSLASIILTGCATTSKLPQIDKYYKPLCPDIKLKKPSSVLFIDFQHATNSEKEIAEKKKVVDQCRNSYLEKGYLFLGQSIFDSALLTPKEVRDFAASKGGDLVIFTFVPAGVEKRSRMVPSSYTSPTVTTTTASGSAVGFGNSQSQITSAPFGAPLGGGINVNTQSTASAYGSSSATTYNPGQVTYSREDYQVQLFTHIIDVFQSPASHLNNWDAVVSWRNANGRATTFDDAKKSAKSFAIKHGLVVPEKYR
jgi:hypothetical protein